MSPFLFSADFGATDLGRKARAEATVLSISDLFGEYVKARKDGDLTAMRQIRQNADPDLLAELDGFDNYPAAA